MNCKKKTRLLYNTNVSIQLWRIYTCFFCISKFSEEVTARRGLLRIFTTWICDCDKEKKIRILLRIETFLSYEETLHCEEDSSFYVIWLPTFRGETDLLRFPSLFGCSLYVLLLERTWTFTHYYQIWWEEDFTNNLFGIVDVQII